MIIKSFCYKYVEKSSRAGSTGEGNIKEYFDLTDDFNVIL